MRAVRSVRARITALATVLVALALTAASVALVLTLEGSLVRSGDALSRSRAADLAGLAGTGALPKTLTNVGDDSVAQVVDEKGRVLAASPNITGAPRISSFVPRTGGPVVRAMRNVPDDDETEDFRVWSLRQDTAQGEVTVYAGTSLESVSEVVGTLRRSLLVGIPALVALLAVAMWVLVSRTLAPVERIRIEVASISHQDLDRRVPVSPYADEIGRLATTMNDMLSRLETASNRQREFVANASHELQSPLAAFRAGLEVALAHADTTDWRATASDLHTEGDRMERLVRDLLFLARSDSEEADPPGELVDLDDVVLEEATRLRTNCSAGVDTSKVTAAPVRGSRDDLTRMVRNLLENARDYATADIEVALADGASGIVLSITDDGPGVAEEHRDRVFDRFYRADAVRSRSAGGTGLGLAIARAIAVRHGGTIELAGCETGARFVVRLPNA